MRIVSSSVEGAGINVISTGQGINIVLNKQHKVRVLIYQADAELLTASTNLQSLVAEANSCTDDPNTIADEFQPCKSEVLEKFPTAVEAPLSEANETVSEADEAHGEKASEEPEAE